MTNRFWQSEPIIWPIVAWAFVAAIGLAGPALALIYFASMPVEGVLDSASAPLLAIALMGAGMIGGAAAGRFGTGLVLALGVGVFLIILTSVLGLNAVGTAFVVGLALLLSSVSFAARGALFARSNSLKGWWIALAVVAGEAAIVVTAVIDPDALPGWLLAPLPAQWANNAISAALSGSGSLAASAALLALGATALATMLVAGLWPRRWPYLIMFTTWITMSALVYSSIDTKADTSALLPIAHKSAAR